MSGIGGDQTLTPEYPGISDAADITSWDPPFPVDLQRVRKKDEDYWDQYRAAPKAIVTLADAQRLWGSRYGKVSSLRLAGSAPIDRAGDRSGRRRASPSRNVRADAISAAQGTTDFGEYFLYFSFFLVVSALLLAYLFFAVGLEQRTTEVGVLASMGFSAIGDPPRVHPRRRDPRRRSARRSAPSAAIGYSALILYGLRTWWVGAVGTTDLDAARRAAVARDRRDRRARRRPGRALARRARDEPPIGALAAERRCRRRRRGAHRRSTKVAAVALLIAGAGLLGAALSGAIDPTAGFFGAGGAWLVGGLCAASIFLRRRRSSSTLGRGLPAMFALGIRHTSVRPARSVLSLALIAFASFVLVSVGAFKKDVSADRQRRALRHRRLRADGRIGRAADARSQHARRTRRPRTRDRRSDRRRARAITRFRLRPGDETSCLTLYRPTNPRIIAPEPRFFDAAALLVRVVDGDDRRRASPIRGCC